LGEKPLITHMRKTGLGKNEIKKTRTSIKERGNKQYPTAKEGTPWKNDKNPKTVLDDEGRTGTNQKGLTGDDLRTHADLFHNVRRKKQAEKRKKGKQQETDANPTGAEGGGRMKKKSKKRSRKTGLRE